MRHPALALVCALVLSSAALPRGCTGPDFSFAQRNYDRLAPFTAVRWRGDVPEARVGGTFRELMEVDGIPCGDLIACARKHHGARWQKRFSEDLVQVMSEFGAPPGRTVSLLVRDLHEGAAPTPMAEVAMTSDNRRAALEFNRRRPRRPDGGADRVLSHAAVASDLAELQALLRTRHSYLGRSAVDLERECEEIGALAMDGITIPALAAEVSQLLAKLGDGHTRLRTRVSGNLPPGRTPLLIFDAKEGVVAVKSDRSGPLHPGYPLLVSIDGIAIEDWIATSRSLSVDGSESLARLRAIRNLRYIGWVAERMGHRIGAALEVVVANAAGARHTLRVPVARKRALYGAWPRRPRTPIPAGVSYLRIPSMESDPATIEEAVASIEAGKDLIIDVRGNGGGTRDLLRAIYPLIAPRSTGPRVVNAARYRLGPGEEAGRPEGYLSDRSLFPVDGSGWTAPEREAIEAFSKSFSPAWTPAPRSAPDPGFSRLHVMVLGPAETSPFVGEVKVLVDASCYSATDVLVAALKGLDNVEVIGETTGGGSGRARRFRLTESGLELSLSSMVSYQPDGQLYDGTGVAPERHVSQPAEFHWGGQDAVLEAALGIDSAATAAGRKRSGR